jgi:hypothetical protein
MAVIGGYRDARSSGLGAASNLVLQSVGLFSTYWLGLTVAAGRGAETFVKGAIAVTTDTFNQVSKLTKLSTGLPSPSDKT